MRRALVVFGVILAFLVSFPLLCWGVGSITNDTFIPSYVESRTYNSIDDVNSQPPSFYVDVVVKERVSGVEHALRDTVHYYEGKFSNAYKPGSFGYWNVDRGNFDAKPMNDRTLVLFIVMLGFMIIMCGTLACKSYEYVVGWECNKKWEKRNSVK